MELGLKGECYGTVSACAAGAHAIGAGYRLVRNGDADACLVGGADAGVTALSGACFDGMGATSTLGVSRPFDKRRDGFILGEGAGVLLLESESVATRRGATILGWLDGYAATADAHHLTAPSGEGSTRAIRLALRDAGWEPEDVDYVNAHGTSTPMNDRYETAAIKAALGDSAATVPVSSTKSAIGHLLGAAGAVEAVATVLALRDADRPADARLRRARRGHGPRLRARRPARARHRRPRPAGDLELVRVRRPQRRPLLRGARLMATLAVAPRRARAPAPTRARASPTSPRAASRRSATRARCARSAPRSPRPRARRRQDNDGVVAGSATIGGRPVYVYAQDPTYLGGSLGARHAESIVRVLRLAHESGVPAIGLVQSGGARMDEGVASLEGYGAIFRAHVASSGWIPQISVIYGTSAGGGCYSPALTDLVVMCDGASMFLTGPGVVKEALGEDVTKDQLGGPGVHGANGVAQLQAADELDAGRTVRALPLLPAAERARAGAARDAEARRRGRPGRRRAGREPPRLRRRRGGARDRRRRTPCSSSARAGRRTCTPR